MQDRGSRRVRRGGGAGGGGRGGELAGSNFGETGAGTRDPACHFPGQRNVCLLFGNPAATACIARLVVPLTCNLSAVEFPSLPTFARVER